jgi:hypothetical protein
MGASSARNDADALAPQPAKCSVIPEAGEARLEAERTETAAHGDAEARERTRAVAPSVT